MTPLLIGLVVAGCGGGQPDAPGTSPTEPPAPATIITTTTATTATTAGAVAEAAAPAVRAILPTPTFTPDAAQEAARAVAASEPATDAAAPAQATAVVSESAAAPPTFVPGQTPVRLETVFEGLDAPTYLTHAGDGTGRIFILEKAGRIRMAAGGQLAAEPFLDITDRVGSSSSEQGLLGLAFAPDYAASGRFYLNYTDRNGNTVIARFRVTDDPNRGDPASEEILLTVPQPAPNHNGGMLAFGPDGYLYVGMGDGGGANDRFGTAQNPAALLGKMLRLDVSTEQGYAIPPDNPWVAADWNGQEMVDEAWSLGLRNPWRFSFDRATQDLWIADVGQNAYEEVNWIPAGTPAGLNFGWPIMEATHCRADGCDPSGLVMPVAEYGREGGHCSITGGYVYRGSAAPALAGAYFYGDYCSGVMWATVPDGAGGWATAQVLESGLSISSFGEDEAGEVYVVDLGGTVARLASE
jgi:glucose/arabinose dehydrogenase